MQKMPYLLRFKTINRVFTCMFFSLLGANCSEKPNASIENQQEHKANYRLRDYTVLGSISCLEGKKNALILHSKVDSKVFAKGLIMGLNQASRLQPDVLLDEALHHQYEVNQYLWQPGGEFIHWHNVDDTGLLRISEEDYGKLITQSYKLHTACTPKNGSGLYEINASTQLPMQALPASIYRLRSIAYSTRQTAKGYGWLFKGSMCADVANAKVGFILAKEGVNPYELTAQIVRTESTWPTKPTLFNDSLLIVPGTLRKRDLILEGELYGHQVPIREGKFKIICYLIQDNHYYLSQLEYFLPHCPAPASQQECPPEINFTGNNYNIQTSDMAVYLQQKSDCITDVRLSDFTIQYIINNQIERLPDDLEACVLFLPKNTIWRTAQLEELFQKLALTGANCKAVSANNAPLCLARKECRLLNASCIDFFKKDEAYLFFTCLFSKASKKLRYYTEQKALKVEIKLCIAPVSKKRTSALADGLTKTARIFEYALENKNKLEEVKRSLDQASKEYAKNKNLNSNRLQNSNYQIAQALYQAIELWKKSSDTILEWTNYSSAVMGFLGKRKKSSKKAVNELIRIVDAFKNAEHASIEAIEIANACKEAAKALNLLSQYIREKAKENEIEAATIFQRLRTAQRLTVQAFNAAALKG